MTVRELEAFLLEKGAAFELLKQETPILSAKDASAYYPAHKAAPTLVLQTENGLIACIASVNSGRMDLDFFKKKFGFAKLKMADKKKIIAQTGYEIGAIPLVGLGLPCIFDNGLLKYDYIYGGSGDELVTLKIAPMDVMRLNKITGTFN